MNEFQKLYQEQIARKKESEKKWYQKNKERLCAKGSKYYADNKERLKKESIVLVQCEYCRTCVRKSSLSHHKNTKKCKELRELRKIYYTSD